MKFIADLHIHSRFSRATARNLDPEHLALWGKKKGVTLIGTGDFTHGGWLSELRDKLVEAENGLYRLKTHLETAVQEQVPRSCRNETRFLLSGEISCIYKRAGKTRKLHHLVLMPDLDAVQRLNKKLGRIGNLSSDGRPILGLDSRDLLEVVLEVSERAFLIPAHIWTPWFSLFGSKSGFDSMEECFGDLTPHVHALETGLSSDPPMNRRLSAIDDYLLVSNSDAHSPAKLGREANIFHTELDYDKILLAMTRGRGFEGTIEFFPEEGKYHLDGHRKCQVRLHPQETRAHEGLCPSCGKPLTVGVLHRVEELSDRDTPKLSKDFHCLIPLNEILSEIFHCGPSTVTVRTAYEELLNALGPELHILMEASLKAIEKTGGPLLSEAIDRMRQDRVIREEGYDGEYGTIRLFDEAEMHELMGQITLFRPKKRKKTGPKKSPGVDKAKAEGKEERLRPEQAPVSDPLLDLLNPEQREAVLHRGGHLLVVAGPGTGKTLTLSHRIAHLLREEKLTGGQVLALTFTNKAAREMAERIRYLLGEGLESGVWVSTFHGFCLQVLRNEGGNLGLPPSFHVCPERDVGFLVEQSLSHSGPSRRIGQKLLKRLHHLKAASVVADAWDPADEDLRAPFEAYQQRLRGLGMLDLDDLEVETLRLFQAHPHVCRRYAERFPRIFVDEYQDTSAVQVAILKRLVREGGPGPDAAGSPPPAVEVCAIGDPDQSIYGFRGARVQNFHAFAQDFPGAKTVSLCRNYRSSQVILRGSSCLMGRTAPFTGVQEGGDPIRLAVCRSHSEEAEMIVEQIEKLIGGTTYFSLDSGRVSSHEEGEGIGFGDVAVLFRLNAQGDALEEAFKRAGIPMIRSGEVPLTRQFPVNVIWRFLQALCYPAHPYHLKAYLDLPHVKGLAGKEILEKLDVNDSVSSLVDQAVTAHGFDLSSEGALEALRRFRGVAEDFDGALSAFLDLLALERGIDHTGYYGDRVALMSLHAAKGLEWPVVFITGCEDGLIPCTLFGDRDEEEEKRLFYVGMTRARTKLILSHAARRSINGRVLQMNPSPFLQLIPEEFCAPLERGSWKPKGKPHKQLGLF